MKLGVSQERFSGSLHINSNKWNEIKVFYFLFSFFLCFFSTGNIFFFFFGGSFIFEMVQLPKSSCNFKKVWWRTKIPTIIFMRKERVFITLIVSTSMSKCIRVQHQNISNSNIECSLRSSNFKSSFSWIWVHMDFKNKYNQMSSCKTN